MKLLLGRRGVYRGAVKPPRVVCTASVGNKVAQSPSLIIHDFSQYLFREYPPMSKIAQYRELERLIAEQQHVLETLKNDKSFQAESEFEDKLRSLMSEYDVGLPQIVALLGPHVSAGTAQKVAGRKGQRAPRALKRYLNPHTNEVVETKGSNHKTLKAWRQEHGSAQVQSWVMA